MLLLAWLELRYLASPLFEQNRVLLPVCPMRLTDRLVSFPFGSFEGSGCLAADRELGQMRTRPEPADQVTHELACPTCREPVPLAGHTKRALSDARG